MAEWMCEECGAVCDTYACTGDENGVDSRCGMCGDPCTRHAGNLGAGAILVRGHEVLVLNAADEWLAPGVLQRMSPQLGQGWRVLRWGWWEDEE